MEKRIITKEQEMFVDKCKKCDTEITGFSEKQVNQRMKVHKTGCRGNNQ